MPTTAPAPALASGAWFASTGTTIAVLVAILVALGLTMIAVAVWLVRATRADPVALGPLEVMGERRWRKGGADRRRTDLDDARPPGAAPPASIAAVDSEPIPESEPTDPTPPETAAAPPETADSAETATSPENCESSMQESAVSAHSSEDGAADEGDRAPSE